MKTRRVCAESRSPSGHPRRLWRGSHRLLIEENSFDLPGSDEEENLENHDIADLSRQRLLRQASFYLDIQGPPRGPFQQLGRSRRIIERVFNAALHGLTLDRPLKVSHPTRPAIAHC